MCHSHSTAWLKKKRVAWAPGEICTTFQADHPYQKIKAQRISAETSSKVQLQLVLHCGGHVNFHFTASNALKQRQQVKEQLARALSKVSSPQISPELEAKNHLLKSNPGVYQLYKDLVTTGLISAEEFWANKSLAKLTGDNADALRGQESGLPSAFLADVQAVYDGCNAVRYNLSADVIQAIFKIYPTVKEKHVKMVPQEMKEEDFWTQFFQSQFFHHEKRSDQFADCLSQEKLTSVGPGVEMSLVESASSMLEEGYSTTPECHTSKTPLSLVQRCNHHSNRVLEALMEGSTAALPPPETTPTSSMPLHLQLRAASQASAAECSILPVAQQLTSWQLQQEVLPSTAHSAVPYLAPGSSLVFSGGCGQKASTLLTREQQQEVFRHQAAIAELLRHFWSCFPARTVQLEAKAHKMHQCLVEYAEKQLRELEDTLDNTDSLRIVQHLQDCMARASQHYHKWAVKKKTSHRT